MIPTSIANSPTATITSVSGAASQNKNNCRNDQKNYTSVILGIASLILEGRPIADDDYQTHNNRPNTIDNLSSDNSCPFDGHCVSDGRQSPRPAVSRTGTSSSGCVINITTNPYALAGATPPLTHMLPVAASPSCTDSNLCCIENNSLTLSESTHQRWTQKLCQLRKISPAAQSVSTEPELVALTINDTLNAERTGNDFEIVRRVMLNRTNLTVSNNIVNTSLGLGSENILHSLQSLATTCLRGGSPTLDSVPTGIHMPLFSPPKHATISSRFSHSPHLLATTATFPAKANSPKSAQKTKRLQHGPHCDQFLRKMGLAKGEIADSEEHFCDMSYVNIACSRWRAYNLKIEAIIARSEPICIEVYLGPVSHKILLEQWIITCKEKMSPPTMTLPSLCSAIRSQLYFSQIVAWCDLLRKSDKSIYDTGRVIFSNSKGNAGDLVVPSIANITTISSSSNCARQPRLNIFYRINQYDATDCFNTKPNIHNFPCVNISENISISICVKSLPRINGGIPKVIATSASISPAMHLDTLVSCNASTPSNGGGLCAVTPTGLGARILTDDTTPRTSRLSLQTSVASGIASKTINNCDIKSQHCYDSLLCAKFKNSQPILGETKDESDYFFEQTNGMGNTLISHREKQLQKYRKRMLKRDKKRERKFLDPSHKVLSDDSTSNISNSTENNIQPMDQCDDAHGCQAINSSSAQQRTSMVSTGTQTPMACCQQCGREKMLMCLICNGPEHRNHILTGLIELDDSSSSSSSSKVINVIKDQVNVPSKAEILLQAIQRTPKNKKNTELLTMSKIKNSENGPYDLNKPIDPPISVVNNNQSSHKVLPKSGGSCQVCKRQKTQHIFSNSSAVNEKSTSKTNLLKCTINEIAIPNVDVCMDVTNNVKANNVQKTSIFDSQDYNSVSTRLTPQIDRCTIEDDSQTGCRISNFNLNDTRSRQCHYLATDQSDHVDRNASSLMQFKAPSSNAQKKEQQEVKDCAVLNITAKSNFQQICDYSTASKVNSMNLNIDQIQNVTSIHRQFSPLSHRKVIPKVNLTPIFCKSKSTAAAEEAHSGLIEFSDTDASQADITKIIHTHSQAATVSADLDNNIPVQKSYSAPTLPNSLSLSPRFTKQASFYKRRSRHLSDRSDRSSLGSDELLSDEDYDGTQYSPATSPIKSNFRMMQQFGRKPLLGNLEESLLQKRFLPKMEVMGFKVLLGASGGFCPTQLTIPATTYFYELLGETLCTPYLCEIRLPRKGYSVPRTGTVQATLLNPMGTVVRMFVIPYDMRDMPPLHRTFIRQRILAEESSINTRNSSVKFSHNGDKSKNKPNGNNCLGDSSSNSILGHFISADQMKRLRYSIHVRFQTSRSGRLSLHTDIRLLISRRTDCDTAAAHAKAKGALEAPNELIIDTLIPQEPRYSSRQESSNKI